MTGLYRWRMPGSNRGFEVEITNRPTMPAPMVRVTDKEGWPVTDMTPKEVEYLAAVVPEVLAVLHRMATGESA